MRKKKDIDLEQVEEMASEFCTQAEIAQDLGFERTLFRTREDVSAAFNRGKNGAKMSLRHMMFNAARSGDRTMMIFLAKNELGYCDKPEPLHEENEENDSVNPLLEALTMAAENLPIEGDTPELADESETASEE